MTTLAAPDSCDGLVFSPMNLLAAIAPTDGMILAARAAAYGVPLTRRRPAVRSEPGQA